MHDPSSLEILAERRAREKSRAPVGPLASGRLIVLCPPSTQPVVLLRKDDYADLQIAPALGGRGVLVEPWNTPDLIAALTMVAGQS